ncbi:hypothetical protein CLV35_1774 [Motilibacter peucedani]|uniref:Uncharacterized protein n=1 Tax=Motilibacter peucedani TaxID=598650 RepID=A0A420XPZ1_9ACTN|nr:hypothetical protein [Motilibacter peucedani]RKS75314.1 hypothetical protein CLV35_1774 [Motilibacter peucedani]
MTAPVGSGAPAPDLTADEAAAVRDAVAEAVLGTPSGLRDALENDPDAYLRLVAASRVAAEQTSQLLRESVAGARAAGHSWDTLGRLLGVSKQAAQQRFAAAAPDPGDPGPHERRVLTPLTAFDEMSVLEREGRAGWHVVSYGPLYHVVEASSTPWEHRRVPWAVGRRARWEAGGWQQVPGPSFPWSYWKRPVRRDGSDRPQGESS